MVELKSLQMFLILMIPFTAVTRHDSSITVRVGGKATLHCKGIKDHQDKYNSTTWIFSDSTTRQAVTLFEYRKILREPASKSDRLSVTEKCSLVIKKVTYEDAGRYSCRQFDESGKQVANSEVDLIVIKRDNIATTTTTTTKRTAKATTRPTTTTTKRTAKATTRPTTTTTTKRTAKATTRSPTTTTKRTAKATTRPTTTTTTTKRTAKATTRSPPPPTDPAATDLLKVLIPVAVVLAALLIIVVAVIRWKKAKGNNTQLDDNTADPPDGVSYASVRYKKKTKRKAQVQGEDDTVTYSTVNISSTSAGASTDPRNLYASINKTNT